MGLLSSKSFSAGDWAGALVAYIAMEVVGIFGADATAGNGAYGEFGSSGAPFRSGIGWPEITVDGLKFVLDTLKSSSIGMVPIVIGRSSGVTLLQQLSTAPVICNIFQSRVIIAPQFHAQYAAVASCTYTNRVIHFDNIGGL